jgi:heat shock protein HslJ
MVKVKPLNYKHLLLLAASVAISSSASLVAQANPSDIADKAWPLTGTQWKLVFLGQNPVPRTDQSYLILKAAQQFATGSVGQLVSLTDSCGNELTGVYKSKNDSLRIRFMTSTLVACLVAPPKKQENGTSTPVPPHHPRSFPEALSETSRFAIHGPTLDLLNREGTIVARLVDNDQN